MFFVLLRPIFCEKWKIAPPIRKEPPSNVWTCEIGRKIALNFGEDFFFFGDHLILGGKNRWISDHSDTFRLKFRTNPLKLIQGQWKFESRSFAHFSLFRNSPPLFQILATRLHKYYINCNYIFFTKLPWPGDSEGNFQSPSQDATFPSVYHTRWRLHTVPLIAERQAGKLWKPIFIVFGLIRPGIEPESTFQQQPL